jgi:hypothetical protein
MAVKVRSSAPSLSHIGKVYPHHINGGESFGMNLKNCMSVETSGTYVERRLYMDIIHMESEQNRNSVVVLARQST